MKAILTIPLLAAGLVCMSGCESDSTGTDITVDSVRIDMLENHVLTYEKNGALFQHEYCPDQKLYLFTEAGRPDTRIEGTWHATEGNITTLTVLGTAIIVTDGVLEKGKTYEVRNEMFSPAANYTVTKIEPTICGDLSGTI